ncbi:LysR family transcriptional regulator [Bordetella genomosp. 9]|nr:LysR family transcriptional regulator [Bordetella genomosp. 9]
MKSPDFAKLRVRDLELLREIATVRSLTAIAESRGLTQPALSRALHDIEAALGTQVFSRDRAARLEPTPLGSLILSRVELMLAEADGLRGELLAFEEGRGTHLRLGVIPFVSNQLMREILKELTTGPYAMSISTYEASTDQLVSALRRQELDAVLGRITVDGATSELHQEKLFTQSASVLVNARSDLAGRKALKLEDLHRHEWVLPPQASPTRLAFAQLFVARGATPPSARIETTSARLIHTAISGDIAVLGLLPLDIAMELETWGGVKAVDLPAPFKMPPVGLITLAKRQRLPAGRILRDVVRGVLARSVAYR